MPGYKLQLVVSSFNPQFFHILQELFVYLKPSFSELLKTSFIFPDNCTDFLVIKLFTSVVVIQRTELTLNWWTPQKAHCIEGRMEVSDESKKTKNLQ